LQEPGVPAISKSALSSRKKTLYSRQRAQNSRKSALYFRPALLQNIFFCFGKKLCAICHSLFERSEKISSGVYVSYVPAKEPYIGAKEHCISAKEPRVILPLTS